MIFGHFSYQVVLFLQLCVDTLRKVWDGGCIERNKRVGETEMNKVTIWSTRFSGARGNHIVAERQCNENEAQQWLEIFRSDEPNVCFIASKRKPKI